MKLIVGIGNPGHEYALTRHNVGFIILDNYASASVWKTNKEYSLTMLNVHGEQVILLKPLTYVNLSGYAVSKVAHYYKVPPKDILVIHDDLDLQEKKYRLKTNSSSGGHNGIKSIIEQLGSKEFSHLKVGIGNDKKNDTKSYVLAKLSKEEIEFLKSNIFKEIIDYYILNGIEKTMNKYNAN